MQLPPMKSLSTSTAQLVTTVLLFARCWTLPDPLACHPLLEQERLERCLSLLPSLQSTLKAASGPDRTMGQLLGLLIVLGG